MREFKVHTILELSCAAYRTLGRYIKERDMWRMNLNPKETPTEIPTRQLIRSTLRLERWEDQMPPKDLVVTDEDREFANEIKRYFKRLTFTLIEKDNLFDSNINKLLISEYMTENNIGYIAYVPEMYHREVKNTRMKKAINQCDNEHLGAIGQQLFDLDAEIIHVSMSKNYEAWNISAIIDNKMCSWMSKRELKLGPAVIVMAKVKDFTTDIRWENPVTRLNYVRAAQ